eukprot:CAMPEP_0197575360 /NCGR_PEP_ID=MMETSP1326-20131121/786_1 /TAXON_ID=1155430 /ORGANISM="Genus nov. species nov., Strain RCC2288" /LENGTH=294 /DNA_ID=CAMNT_0043138117 /DNA_START=31 /DNA_END=915 /DNA_ORIENTATION=+
MADYAAKANDFMAKAQKKLKAGMFATMFGGNKYEEAGELLEKASNNYKLAKMWSEAAAAFVQLADCHVHLDSKHEAASAYVEAANANKKVDVEAAVANLRVAVSFFADMGRLAIAAKHLKDVGELYEKEEKLEQSCEAYMQAADLYSGEEVSTTANNCKLKVAELSATLERYPLAIEVYEEVAKASMDNNLLKFSVKGYLLNAGICRLCSQDAIGVKNALERYEDVDPSFGDSRECNLLKGLADAAEEGDQDKYTSVLSEYDSMSRLDAWKTTLLLRAKKKIVASVAEEEDDLT